MASSWTYFACLDGGRQCGRYLKNLVKLICFQTCVDGIAGEGKVSAVRAAMKVFVLTCWSCGLVKSNSPTDYDNLCCVIFPYHGWPN